ncbi:unnamed protein product, partial [Staurois parvus]
MCHFQVSSHCWWVSMFCHRVLQITKGGPPLLLARARNLPWAPVPTAYSSSLLPSPVISSWVPVRRRLLAYSIATCSCSCYSLFRIPSAHFLGIRFQETSSLRHTQCCA